MKKLGFVMALLSAISFTAFPAYANDVRTPKPAKSRSVQKTGTAVISQAQLAFLATSSPVLHTKLAMARDQGTMPKLSTTEAELLSEMSRVTENEIKAGLDPALTTALTTLLVAIVYVFIAHAEASAKAIKEGKPVPPSPLCYVPFLRMVPGLGCPAV